MDEVTRGGMQRDRDRVGDTVVHVDQLDVKAAEAEAITRVLLDQLRRRGKAVLLELVLDKSDRQSSSVYRELHL